MKRIFAGLVFAFLALPLVAQNQNFGSISTYPACTGSNVPCVVFLSGQTAAIASTTAYTAPANGIYRVSSYVVVTSAGTGTSIQPIFNFNNGTANDSFAGAAAGVTVGSRGSLTATTIIVGSGQAIKYQLAFNSITGNPTYQVAFVIEQLY